MLEITEIPLSQCILDSVGSAVDRVYGVTLSNCYYEIFFLLIFFVCFFAVFFNRSVQQN